MRCAPTVVLTSPLSVLSSDDCSDTVTDSAAEPRHLNSAPRKPGKHVLELRQFDLELPLARSCAAGEDVQDKLRAVDDFHVQCPLQVSLLRWRQVFIEDHDVRFPGLDLGAKILQLA